MHKIIICTLLLYLLVFFNRCSSDNKLGDIVDNWYGKKVILQPFPQIIYNQSTNGNFKIVTRINGNCYSCINELKEWKLFIREINDKYKIPLYIYMAVTDSIIYSEINKKEVHFDYPVIYDYNDEFKKINKLHENTLFHTMLLDKDNKVLLIGSPIRSQSLKKIYIKRICTQNLKQ